MAKRPLRALVEWQWDQFNAIFKSVFNRDPAQRPSATTLLEQLMQLESQAHLWENIDS